MHILSPDQHPRRPGILFAEDFDDAPSPIAPAAPEAEPEFTAPGFTADDMAGARREGFAAGQRAAQEEAALRLQDAARQGCERLGELVLRVEAMRAAQLAEAADAASRLIFAALAACLPSLSTRHAVSEIAHLLHATLAGLAPDQALTATVAPETVEVLRGALASLPRDQTRRIVLAADDSLATGDARIAWEGGTAVRHGRLAQDAVQDILANLDLLPPAPPRLAALSAVPQPAPQNVENVHA